MWQADNTKVQVQLLEVSREVGGGERLVKSRQIDIFIS